MADEMRAMLDALMGPHRNEVGYVQTFKDPEICRLYLTGLCPKGMFANTRFVIPECDKIHSDHLKAQYEEERKHKDFGYEREAAQFIADIVAKNDAYIVSQNRELRMKEEAKQEGNPLAPQIAELEARAARAGEEGEIEEYNALQRQIEALKREGNSAMPPGMDGAPQTKIPMKLFVCDVCGSFLEDWEDKSRLKDHYEGKIHNGFAELRAQLEHFKKLGALNARPPSSRSRERSPPRLSRSPGHSRERSPPRSGSRDRDARRRYRDEPYHRRDDRDRDRRRDRDYDRDRRR